VTVFRAAAAFSLIPQSSWPCGSNQKNDQRFNYKEQHHESIMKFSSIVREIV
jgi:hypothetical protein